MQPGGALLPGLRAPAGLFPKTSYRPARQWRRLPCLPCRASVSVSGSALTATRTVASATAVASKANFSAVVNLLAVVGIINSPGTVGAAHPQGVSGGLSVVLLVLALMAPLGGGFLLALLKMYDKMEPWIFPSKRALEQEPMVLYGVDVTGSAFFSRPAVLRAVSFAAAAHAGQARKTGEPYVAHCIETALIVEDTLSPTEDDSRAEAAVIAAVLHDVTDDTSVSLAEVEAAFGEQIASMVSKVSQLSQTNQLVRRRMRLENLQPTKEDERKLELLMLAMVSEPLVIVIKLADRLHNMRTVYALPPDKQRAVALETRKVWCTLAERLGIVTLKSELEDLCFAVLQPHEFRALRDAVFEYCGIAAISPDSLNLSALSMDEEDTSTGPPAIKSSSSTSSSHTGSTFISSTFPSGSNAATSSPNTLSSSTTSDSTLPSSTIATSSSTLPKSTTSGNTLPSNTIATSSSSSSSTSSSSSSSSNGAISARSGASSSGSRNHWHSRTTTTSSSSSSSSSGGGGNSREGASPLRPWPRPDPLDALPHHHPPPDSLVARPPPRGLPGTLGSAAFGLALSPLSPSSASQLSQSSSSASPAAAANAKAAGGSTQGGLGIPGPGGRFGQNLSSMPSSSSSSMLSSRLANTSCSMPSSGSMPSSSGGSMLSMPGSSFDSGSMASSSGEEWLTPQQLQVKELLDSVLPFHASTFNMARLRIASNARRGLEVLQQCAMLLLREVRVEGLASGLEVSVQGRVKSLYSIFKKMTRKGVPVSQVYDARALRVVVHDAGGLLQREAIAACYRLLPAVHRLWRKIPGEEDDYMATPKPSGYQSLHTAVIGPGGVAMEVQIRTSSMHEDAEYGKAAHWAYKERPANPGAPGVSKPHEIAAGDPLLQVGAAGRMRQGTVLDVRDEGLRLLVALSHNPPSQAGSMTRAPSPEECRRLTEQVADREWWAPGLGDHEVAVELYTLCSDGRYHRLDHFGHKQPTIIIPTKHNPAPAPGEEGGARAPEHGVSSGTGGDFEYMDNRIRLLRSMLEWRSEDISTSGGIKAERESVIVLIWPAGRFLLLPKGTTAGEVVVMHGDLKSRAAMVEAGGMVNVNNRLVGKRTRLKDGDYVVLSQELLQI